MPQDPAETSASKSDRRYEPRHPFEADLEIEWGSATISGRVLDISPGGMFLISSEPLWLGARFYAKLLTKPPIHVECTVRHIEPGRGIAVTIALTDSLSQARFTELLASLGPAK